MLRPDWAVWWLHFPKCGSSLRDSILDFKWSKDRDRSWPAGNHQVLFPDIAGRMGTPDVRVAAMFRQPESRLVSAYFHMRDLIRVRPSPGRRTSRFARPTSGPKEVGCCWDDWGWPTAVWRPVHQKIMNGAAVEETLGHFHGCQTSMTLGKGCMSGHAQTPHHVAQAIQLVDRFAFVGLMDQWSLSMCLMNAIFTGRRFTLRHQLHNTRPTSSKLLPVGVSERGSPAAQAAARAAAVNASRLHTVDPIDGALYAFARMRFWADVKEHRVSAACCPSLDNISQLLPAHAEPVHCLPPPPPPPPLRRKLPPMPRSTTTASAAGVRRQRVAMLGRGTGVQHAGRGQRAARLVSNEG